MEGIPFFRTKETGDNKEIELEPKCKLIVYTISYNKVQEGTHTVITTIFFKAKIVNSKGEVVKDNIDAYDVDYMRITENQTYIIDEKRYNSNEEDEQASTPSGDFGPNTVKMSPSVATYILGLKGCVLFEDGGRKGEIKVSVRSLVEDGGNIGEVETDKDKRSYVTPNIKIKTEIKHKGKNDE